MAYIIIIRGVPPVGHRAGFKWSSVPDAARLTVLCKSHKGGEWSPGKKSPNSSRTPQVRSDTKRPQEASDMARTKNLETLIGQNTGDLTSSTLIVTSSTQSRKVG
jgi:hypothetical protein